MDWIGLNWVDIFFTFNVNADCVNFICSLLSLIYHFLIFSQDLMPKFEIIVIENENETDSKVNEQEACDLSKMSMELSPLSMVVATEEGVTPSNNVSAIVVMNPSMDWRHKDSLLCLLSLQVRIQLISPMIHRS